MTLREFKEVFHSKPTSYTVTLYCSIHKKNIRINKKYFELYYFYVDDYCDDFVVSDFSVLDVSIRDIFISIFPEDVDNE